MRALLAVVVLFAALTIIENLPADVAGFIGLGAFIGLIFGLIAILIKLIRSI